MWSFLARSDHGGVLCLVAKYNTFHYVWLTDGFHLIQGVFCAGAVATLVLALRSGRWWWLLSLILFTSGLLVREDSLVIAPALVVLGAFYARYQQTTPRRTTVALYGYYVVLAAICAAFLVYRATLLSGTPASTVNALGWLIHMTLAFSLPGMRGFDTLSGLFSILWIGLFMILIGGWIVYRRALAWQLPVVWLLCAIFACAPGVMIVRNNLLLFPITFAALFVVTLLSSLTTAVSWWRFVGVAMIICGLAGGSYASFVTAQAFHPSSITALKWNSEMLYAESTRTATVPAERRAAMVNQLAQYGIRSDADAKASVTALIEEAKQAQHFTPTRDGIPFLPKQLGFLEP